MSVPINPDELPRDLDGCPYRVVDGTPWRLTPCCGALVEPNTPKPEQKPYRVELRGDRR